MYLLFGGGGASVVGAWVDNAPQSIFPSDGVWTALPGTWAVGAASAGWSVNLATGELTWNGAPGIAEVTALASFTPLAAGSPREFDFAIDLNAGIIGQNRSAAQPRHSMHQFVDEFSDRQAWAAFRTLPIATGDVLRAVFATFTTTNTEFVRAAIRAWVV